MLAVIACCVEASLLVAGPPPAKPLPVELATALETITGRDVIAHAKILSDAKFRGRSASSPPARRAAQYIADELRALGLRPGGNAGSFYQVFKIHAGYRIRSHLEVRVAHDVAGNFRPGVDYRPIFLPNGKAAVSASVALVGYGITSDRLKFDEYGHVDVKGKAVIVFTGTPWSFEAARWLRRGVSDPRYDSLAYKVDNAAAHGAACVLVVDNPAGWRRQIGVAEQLAPMDIGASFRSTIPVVHVTRAFVSGVSGMSVAELRLLAAEIGRDMQPESTVLRARQIRLGASVSGRARIGRNVVAVLPGRDEKLRKEAVVLGAHYDHLGEGAEEEIYFGANDNAAGVGALLSVARAFTALATAPRRTVVVVAFDAEEIGRLGSHHYVAKPPIPIDKTAMMINFDMIGRNEPNEIFAVGTRSSKEVHQIHQEMNRYVGLKLNHPASFRLGRSDHSPFYFAGVPILYLFGGLDPDYSTPGDTWDKLIPRKVEKVSRLAFLTARAVAESADRPVFISGSGQTGFGIGK